MKAAIISQYRAALRMVFAVIDTCPEWLWDNSQNSVAYWQLVYHALYFTDLYLANNAQSFIRWQQHRQDFHRLGGLPVDRTTLKFPIYTKAELAEYTTLIDQRLQHQIRQQNFDAPSGFDWLIMYKLELHVYNLRHLQHHTGQLVERLHQEGISGIPWLSQFFDG